MDADLVGPAGTDAITTGAAPPARRRVARSFGGDAATGPAGRSTNVAARPARRRGRARTDAAPLGALVRRPGRGRPRRHAWRPSGRAPLPRRRPRAAAPSCACGRSRRRGAVSRPGPPWRSPAARGLRRLRRPAGPPGRRGAPRGRPRRARLPPAHAGGGAALHGSSLSPPVPSSQPPWAGGTARAVALAAGRGTRRHAARRPFTRPVRRGRRRPCRRACSRRRRRVLRGALHPALRRALRRVLRRARLTDARRGRRPRSRAYGSCPASRCPRPRPVTLRRRRRPGRAAGRDRRSHRALRHELGQGAAQEVLDTLARRARALLPAGDVVAWLGEDASGCSSRASTHAPARSSPGDSPLSWPNRSRPAGSC